ncbi:hypothetical protein [Escherichia phage phiWec179]|nr:hypothetical protein [Escherichia phage phiWec179]BDU12306.1 hypothetical protein [Escherichia phage phiWec181]BDU12746.1 hypothetical protein [Escherichia phage phiWec186]
MRSTYTGKINSGIILAAAGIISKTFKVANLPECVDFDHVFNPLNPSRCVVRSNVENPNENLFYVTSPSQSILNQVEAKIITEGSYFSLLPCKSVEIEDSITFANNLVLTMFMVSDKDCGDDMVLAVRNVYDTLGIAYSCKLCDDYKSCSDFYINGVRVCRVESYWVQDTYITVANVINEPMFSHALALII